MSLNIKTAVTPENPTGYIRVAGNAANVTTASNVIYTNTTSGLSAVTVQAAIDETVVKIKDIELFKFPNATIIGSPTINNGQISGFSNANYMRFPFIVNMQGRPFVITMAFITGTDVTAQQNILDGVDHGLAFAIRGGKFILVMGSTSGEWDITNGEKESSISVTASTSYMIRLSWTGSVYKFEYSTDGETYTEDETMRVTSSASLYPTQIFIGNSTDLTHPFVGIVNMNYSSLQIAGKIIWTGMDDVGLATRMAVDMSNIDDAGIEKINRVVMKDYDKPEELPEDEESIKETDEIKEAIGKLEYKVDSKGTAIPVYTKVTYAEAVARGEIKSGSQFIISDDYTDEYLTEVKDARTNSAIETPVTYADLKTRLDTDYADIMEVIDELPTPMVFKGTVGTGGTITTLPTAAASNTGFTYKVITDGIIEGVKNGDTVISTGTKWEIVPSGDEPSGTVTNVAMTVPTGLTVTGSPITTSGTIAVALDTGYEIPTSASLVNKVNNITPTNNNVTLAGNNIATKSTTYSKATSETDITYDTTVDAAIGQLDYRTDILKQNKVDKTTVSAEGIAETTATITVPAKAKAVAVQKMYGKTVKVKQLFDGCTYDNANVKISTNSTTKAVTITANGATGTIYAGIADAYGTSNQALSISGHKYYVKITGNNSTTNFAVYNDNGGVSINAKSASSVIGTATKDARFFIRMETGTTFTATVYIIILDLTLMGMENKTVGEIDELFDQPFYTNGSYLLNAANESVVSIGKNRFEETYNCNGKSIAAYNHLVIGKCYLQKGETYSIEFKRSSGFGAYQIYINGFEDGDISIDSTYYTKGYEVKTFTALKDIDGKTIKLTSTVAFENYTISDVIIAKTGTSSEYVKYSEHTAEIPISLTNLDDYGVGISDSVSNILDFSNGIYEHNCLEMDLGNYDFVVYDNNRRELYINYSLVASSMAVSADYTYTTVHPSTIEDKTFTVYSNGYLYLRDSSLPSLTDTAATKAALKGKKIIVQVAKTTKDISDIIRPLKVESGGTVTFVNEHNIDCDTTVKYKKEI